MPDFTLNPVIEMCEGDTLFVQNTSTGGQANLEWFLDGNPITVAGNSFPLLLNAGPNFSDFTHVIELRAAGACGTFSKIDSIRVRPGVQANFGVFPDSTCSGDTIRFNQISEGNVDTYEWFENGVLISTAPQLPSRILTTGIYNYSLVVTNDCQSDTLTKEVRVFPVDITAFAEADRTELCLGDTLRLESFSSLLAAVSWEFGDGSTAAGRLVDHVYANTGAYEVKLYARACGVDSFSIPINIYELPQPQLVHDPSACKDDSVQVEISTSGPRYSLMVDSQSIRTPLTYLQFDQAGTFDLILSDTTDKGCTASLYSSLTIHPKPTAGFQLDLPICANDPLDLQSTATGDIFSTFWDFGDSNTGSGANITHAFASEGRYTIEQIVASSRGCEDSFAEVIEVNPSPSPFFISDTNPVCAPIANFGFTNLTPENDILTYEWDFGNTLSSSLRSPFTSYEQANTYLVSLTATNQFNCSQTYSEQVVVYPQPVAEIVVDYESNCAPMLTQISIQPTEYTFIQYTIDQVIQIDSSAFRYSFGAVDQGHEIRVELNYEGFCPAYDTIRVNPVMRPTADFFTNRDSAKQGVASFVNRSLDATHYIWDFGDGGSSELEDPRYEYPDPGKYDVVLYAYNGPFCVDSTTDFFDYIPDGNIKVPTGFTPNDDGYNDRFRIFTFEVNLLEISIFNRWGQCVFMRTGEDVSPEEWDGKNEKTGNDVPEGVYVVKYRYRKAGLEEGDKENEETRTVTVIR